MEEHNYNFSQAGNILTSPNKVLQAGDSWIFLCERSPEVTDACLALGQAGFKYTVVDEETCVVKRVKFKDWKRGDEE